MCFSVSQGSGWLESGREDGQVGVFHRYEAHKAQTYGHTASVNAADHHEAAPSTSSHLNHSQLSLWYSVVATNKQFTVCGFDNMLKYISWVLARDKM